MTAGVLVLVLLVGMALIALTPVSIADLQPAARPLSDYERAVAAIEAKRRNDEGHIAAGGQSILLTHGRRTPTAVVLLHGYTNSPLQFDSLARMVHARGDNVYVPLLPEHARAREMPHALSHLTAAELRASADSAVDLAIGLGDTVIVVGLSLGGTMAAWIAQQRPEAAKVVAIAPILALDRVPTILATPLMNVAVRLPGFIGRTRLDQEEPDRELGWSTRAVGEIMRLGAAARRNAAERAPAVSSIAIVLNDHDRTIAARPVVELAQLWSEHGARVEIRHISASLGLPHDVIDPRQPIRRPDVVYPLLLELLRPAHQ